MEELKQGTVTRSTGSWFSVKTGNGEMVQCRIKGKFRILGIRTTNPVSVGDRVWFSILKDGTGVINKIDARKNYIIRKATKLSKEAHILASNIDQVLLVASLSQPHTPIGFIDRFLITAEAYSVPAIVICNKVDLMDEKSEETLYGLYETYSKIGYEFIATSVPENKNLDKVAAVLKDKITLVSGQSGVGKSSLINTLEPGLELETAEVSTYNEKGIHTTTFAEMFELSIGGSIIDTPGIRSFGVIDFEKQDLYHYFPELFKLSSGCKFHNCQHIDEPKCAVKEALEKGEVAQTHYKSYLNVYFDEELETEH